MTVSLSSPAPWTAMQGQYLAFIYAHTTTHGRGPAERDLERFFGMSAPGVHAMVKTLERLGFLRRQPGVARSLLLLVEPETLPVLRRPA